MNKHDTRKFNAIVKLVVMILEQSDLSKIEYKATYGDEEIKVTQKDIAWVFTQLKETDERLVERATSDRNAFQDGYKQCEFEMGIQTPPHMMEDYEATIKELKEMKMKCSLKHRDFTCPMANTCSSLGWISEECSVKCYLETANVGKET